MYWIYRTHVFHWQGRLVQAKLVDPLNLSEIRAPRTASLHSPLQDESYGDDLNLTFQVNPSQPHPDNYADSVGFNLYSYRLVALMQQYEVKAEVFPVRMVNKAGQVIPGLDYYIYHITEGVLPAMDEALSEWTGDHRAGIPRLALALDKFDHRPIFLCNNIYLPLVRDDLKRAIISLSLSGFDFLRPENYHSGRFGEVIDYDV